MGARILAIIDVLLLVAALIVAGTALGAWLITLAWAWVVPDVFAGAVAQGILPADVSFWQALKFMVLLAVLGVAYRGASSGWK